VPEQARDLNSVCEMLRVLAVESAAKKKEVAEDDHAPEHVQTV
jgi:hypothetical protein